MTPKRKPRVQAFECPQCHGWTTGEVKNSRPLSTESGIKRRRECECGHRFNTREVIENLPTYNR